MQAPRQWNDGGRRPGGRGMGYQSGGYQQQGPGGYGQHPQGFRQHHHHHHQHQQQPHAYGHQQQQHQQHQGWNGQGSHHQPYQQHQGKGWGKGTNSGKGKGSHRGNYQQQHQHQQHHHHHQQQQQQQQQQPQGSRPYFQHDNRHQRDKPKAVFTTKYGVSNGISGVFERNDRLSWLALNPTILNITSTWAQKADDETFPITSSGAPFQVVQSEDSSSMDVDQDVDTSSGVVICVVPYMLAKPTTKVFQYAKRLQLAHLANTTRVGQSAGRLIQGYLQPSASASESSYFERARELLQQFGFPEEYYSICNLQVLCEASFEDKKCYYILAHHNSEEPVTIQSTDSNKVLISRLSDLQATRSGGPDRKVNRYIPPKYPDEPYQRAYEFAIVGQQIEECLSRKFARHLMTVFETKREEHAAATLRAQKRAELLSSFNTRRIEAEKEEETKWDSETCDATDDARETFIKEKREAFNKTWDSMWEEESKALEPEPNEARFPDQTLATWIQFLEPHSNIDGIRNYTIRNIMTLLDLNLSKREEDAILQSLKFTQYVVRTCDLINVPEGTQLPQEERLEPEPEPEPTPRKSSPSKTEENEAVREGSEKKEEEVEEGNDVPMEETAKEDDDEDEDVLVDPENDHDEGDDSKTHPEINDTPMTEPEPEPEPEAGATEAEAEDEASAEASAEAATDGSKYTMDELNKLNYKELQSLCKENGISAKGKGQVLKENLCAIKA